jgi:trehalose/maltose transport system substrate-binding protein
VVSYTNSDAENIFWVSGMAAFQLEWALTYEFGVLDKPFRDKVGVTSLPAGKSARVGLLGAYSLGISRTSAHPAEAVQLIQFLIRKQAQSRASTHVETPGRKVEYFEVPLVMKHIYPWWCKAGDTAGSTGVSRPAVVAGSNYEAVSKAYSQALHSVLTRQSTAPAAAADLESELGQIMGSDKAQPAAGSH